MNETMSNNSEKEADITDTNGNTNEAVKSDQMTTYDSATPADVMKAIDLAMRQYFGADNWLDVRNKRFPGLRS